MIKVNIIENYRFGRIVVNGIPYTSDLIIFNDYIHTNWRRKKGHSLHIDDLLILEERKPEILIIGRGMFGLVEIPEELIQELMKRNISILADKTSQAIEKYNELAKKGVKIAGAFHLNC